MTFEEFVAEVKERLRADMQSIRHPEGDIHPALFHYFEGESLRRMKIPRSAFSSRQSKDVLVASIAEVSRLMRPVYIGFETTVWIATYDTSGLSKEDREAISRNEMPESFTRPSKAPGRVEAVQLLAFAADDSQASNAFITRDGRNPPVFADWTPMEFTGGLIVEPLQKSMQRASR